MEGVRAVIDIFLAFHFFANEHYLEPSKYLLQVISYYYLLCASLIHIVLQLSGKKYAKKALNKQIDVGFYFYTIFIVFGLM